MVPPPVSRIPPEAIVMGGPSLPAPSLRLDVWQLNGDLDLGLITANTGGDVRGVSVSGGTAGLSGSVDDTFVIKVGLSGTEMGTARAVFGGAGFSMTNAVFGAGLGIIGTGSVLGSDFGTGAPLAGIIGSIVQISAGTSWGSKEWAASAKFVSANWGSYATPQIIASSVKALSTGGVDLSWLVTDPQRAGSSEKLRSLYKGIQCSLRTGDYNAVASVFQAVDLPSLPAQTLVAILRYSFAAHQKIEGWRIFLSRVRDELERRKLDTAKILSGLEAVSAEQLRR